MDYNKNYYKELDLDKNATEEEIKKAYRKLAHQYHPDKNGGNEEKFKKVNEAHSVLSDSQQKQEYDNRSPNGKSYSPFSDFGSFEFHFGGGANDLFSQFFEGRGNPFENFGFNPFERREEFRENLDINVSAKINLKNIYLNDQLNLKFKKFVHCDSCNGTGFDKESHSEICEICNGTGINNKRKCEYCQGQGKIHTGTCKKCSGEKVILKDSEVTLQNIYQIRNNIRNMHSGFGHQSKYYRDRVGNLILNINVERNDDYQIINNFELQKTINIHYQDAIEGNEIFYNHIDDSTIKIKLPEKTKDGDVIRVKEKGLLKNDKDRGDIYLKINIVIDYERV